MAVASLPSPRATLPPEEPEEDSTSKMSFLEHLDELRKRLIVSLAAVASGFFICIFFINQIFAFIMRPLLIVLPRGGHFIYTEPAEMFMLQLKGAALAGLVLATPVVLYQVWLFIAPGLYSHEKKFAIPFVFMATFFFVSGVLFSHFIAFPWTWAFFASFSTDYVDFMPKVSPVFSFYAKMLLAFGLIFQMPTLVFFLARFGLVTARFLIRYFKYAVLTPGTDVVSQLMMAVPMLLLYGISILIAWIFGKKKRHADLLPPD